MAEATEAYMKTHEDQGVLTEGAVKSQHPASSTQHHQCELPPEASRPNRWEGNSHPGLPYRHQLAVYQSSWTLQMDAREVRTANVRRQAEPVVSEFSSVFL